MKYTLDGHFIGGNEDLLLDCRPPSFLPTPRVVRCFGRWPLCRFQTGRCASVAILVSTGLWLFDAWTEMLPEWDKWGLLQFHSNSKKGKLKVNHGISGQTCFEKTSAWKNGRFSFTTVAATNMHGTVCNWTAALCKHVLFHTISIYFLDGWIWDLIRILRLLKIGDPQNHRMSLFLGKEFHGVGVPN